MDSAVPQASALRLSICITTFNRADFIGETLESILSQTTSECEVVVLDGGSTDDTGKVVSEYTRRFDRLRYVRQDANNGFDRDCDRVVELARGEYCWLMSDDDVLKPGAVETVLQALRRDLSLVILNQEMTDFTLTNVVQARTIDCVSDRLYRREEMDRLFVDVREVLMYLGCLVIRRAIWLARDRRRYYGSLLIHVGVIFQERLPGDAFIIAEPFIRYRMGNAHTFSSKSFRIYMIDWPSLVWSLGISESAKLSVSSAEPWKNFVEVLLWRGWGHYSRTEYEQLVRPRLRSAAAALAPALVARFPGVLANALSLLYYSTTGRPWRAYNSSVIVEILRQSPFYFRNWRVFTPRSKRGAEQGSSQAVSN